MTPISTGALNRAWLLRSGRSKKRYVSAASRMASNTASTRMWSAGVPLSTIVANDRIGQCHKYSGKLISPIQTKGLRASRKRLGQALGPAEMISTDPNVGKSAHAPGNGFAGLIA
jgi:hypothetical protein